MTKSCLSQWSVFVWTLISRFKWFRNSLFCLSLKSAIILEKKNKCYLSNIYYLFWTVKFINKEILFIWHGILIKGIFIVGAKRTAFGTFGGTLKNVTGTQLQAHACKATLESAGVRPDQVDSVIIGNVLVVCIFFHYYNNLYWEL